jgi:hypothetical protein
MSDSATNPESQDAIGDATYRVTANELRQFVEKRLACPEPDAVPRG